MAGAQPGVRSRFFLIFPTPASKSLLHIVRTGESQVRTYIGAGMITYAFNGP